MEALNRLPDNSDNCLARKTRYEACLSVSPTYITGPVPFRPLSFSSFAIPAAGSVQLRRTNRRRGNFHRLQKLRPVRYLTTRSLEKGKEEAGKLSRRPACYTIMHTLWKLISTRASTFPPRCACKFLLIYDHSKRRVHSHCTCKLNKHAQCARRVKSLLRMDNDKRNRSFVQSYTFTISFLAGDLWARESWSRIKIRSEMGRACCVRSALQK